MSILSEAKSGKSLNRTLERRGLALAMSTNLSRGDKVFAAHPAAVLQFHREARRIAKAAHRVYPQRQEPEAEKYFMRGWLLRLDFGGPEFKAARQALLKNLKGCSAFPSAEKAQRHQERWAEIRRQHREERLEQALQHARRGK